MMWKWYNKVMKYAQIRWLRFLRLIHFSGPSPEPMPKSLAWVTHVNMSLWKLCIFRTWTWLICLKFLSLIQGFQIVILGFLRIFLRILIKKISSCGEAFQIHHCKNVWVCFRLHSTRSTVTPNIPGQYPHERNIYFALHNMLRCHVQSFFGR